MAPDVQGAMSSPPVDAIFYELAQSQGGVNVTYNTRVPVPVVIYY